MSMLNSRALSVCYGGQCLPPVVLQVLQVLQPNADAYKTLVNLIIQWPAPFS
jgi:hypothetical protein